MVGRSLYISSSGSSRSCWRLRGRRRQAGLLPASKHQRAVQGSPCIAAAAFFLRLLPNTYEPRKGSPRSCPEDVAARECVFCVDELECTDIRGGPFVGTRGGIVHHRPPSGKGSGLSTSPAPPLVLWPYDPPDRLFELPQDDRSWWSLMFSCIHCEESNE